MRRIVPAAPRPPGRPAACRTPRRARTGAAGAGGQQRIGDHADQHQRQDRAALRRPASARPQQRGHEPEPAGAGSAARRAPGDTGCAVWRSTRRTCQAAWPRSGRRATPEPDEVDPQHDEQEGLQAGLALQGMALLGQDGVQVAGDHDHAEQQHTFVSEGGHAPRHARRFDGVSRPRRRSRHCGLRCLSMSGRRARCTAPCAPRCGSSVALSTKPGVAADLGQPGLLVQRAASGGLDTRLVVAPEPRWTTVAPTGWAAAAPARARRSTWRRCRRSRDGGRAYGPRAAVASSASARRCVCGQCAVGLPLLLAFLRAELPGLLEIQSCRGALLRCQA